MSTAEPPPPHPFVRRVAEQLLVKAERSQRGTSGEGVRLKLDAVVAPELHAHADPDDVRRYELLLRDLERTGWVRLLLDRPREFAGFADRHPRLELLRFDELAQWLGYERKTERWQRRFVDALAARWQLRRDGEGGALLDYLARSPLTSLEMLEVDEAVDCLARLRDLVGSGAAMPLREASARVFHGRSKVLDSREELLRLLGAAPGQFLSAPIQLLVDVPAAFDDVLFVENLVTFERMADARRTAWSRSVLAYASGFRGSARRLRLREGCRLYVRAGTSGAGCSQHSNAAGIAALQAWLFADESLPVAFFGDLDFAGMQILASLREVFPGAVAWRAGYEPLVGLLRTGRGHLPEHAAKEQQTDPGATGCTYADTVLLPAIREQGQFVDQEAFDVTQAESKAGFGA
ncbi:hypothetical protein [Azohydromonas sediminis]|uniref:hypothetical protein n=1 Tax=Azohydromonas sediminis TaxID=2259674 RepID=UPI000E648A4E|nr:hypothetical protein [Azohydromonas sediminis]